MFLTALVLLDADGQTVTVRTSRYADWLQEKG